MHSIAYDEIHDEIVVPQPFSQALLIFRGGATGEEAPIRVIQGPLTQLTNYWDQLAIDPVHNEIFVPVGYPTKDRVVVFSREANGNVAPIRVLEGPDTLRGASSVAVDPVHNLFLVSGTSAAGTGAVMIFDRTAQGNAKPLRVIEGPKTHLGGGRGLIFAYPPRNEIIIIRGGGGNVGDADTDTPPRSAAGAGMANEGGAFVSVWSIDDKGDVAPRQWKLAGPDGTQYDARAYWSVMGAGVDTKNKSIMIGNKTLNSVLTYSFPEIF